MNWERAHELRAFFSSCIADAVPDPQAEQEAIRGFLATASPARRSALLEQARAIAQGQSISLEDLGAEANRWFESEDDARAWLGGIVESLETASGSAAQAGTPTVKDSNGTPL